MITHELHAELFHGIDHLEAAEHGMRPHRLPAWVGDQFPDPQLLGMEGQPSGVRLRFRTAATRISLVTHPDRFTYTGLERPRGAIDVRVDGALLLRDRLTVGDLTVVDMRTGDAQRRAGAPHTTEISGLPGEEQTVEIWLPHNERVDVVALAADAELVPAAADAGPLWVHHGSSISQGSNATGPSEIWPAVAAQRLGLDLRNLGVGGSAFVDPFLARVIRDAPADVISLKFGINIVNLDAMRLRTLVPAVHGFLDTVREGHPNTPILLMSPIHCAIHEHTPGPGAFDPAAAAEGRVRFIATGTEGDTDHGRLTLSTVRQALRDVVAHRAADPHLHYLEGTDLYGADDERRIPLPDALHPDTEAHRLIGERFVGHVRSEARPFGDLPLHGDAVAGG